MKRVDLDLVENSRRPSSCGSWTRSLATTTHFAIVVVIVATVIDEMAHIEQTLMALRQ